MFFQAQQLGLAQEWPTVKRAYAVANELMGDIVKVTPSSKVVGDLAQFMVANNLLTKEAVLEKAGELNFPTSVIEFLQGFLGEPYVVHGCLLLGCVRVSRLGCVAVATPTPISHPVL